MATRRTTEDRSLAWPSRRLTVGALTLLGSWLCLASAARPQEGAPTAPLSAASGPAANPSPVLPPGPPPLSSPTAPPWIFSPAERCPARIVREPASCPTQICGNGRIDDRCLRLPPPGRMRGGEGGGGGEAPESCDGSALGGASCTSLGFSGGTLRCSGVCSFDVSGCQACAHGPGLLGCQRADLNIGAEYPAGSFPFALAAGSGGLALAWLSGFTATEGARVAHLAMFRPDLSKLRESSCAHQTQLGVVPGGVAVALSPRPGGFWFAASGRHGTTLRALDAAGYPLPGLVRTQASAAVSLVPLADGRALLHWPEAYGGNLLADWVMGMDDGSGGGGHPPPRPALRPFGIVGQLLQPDGSALAAPTWLANGMEPHLAQSCSGPPCAAAVGETTPAPIVLAGTSNYVASGMPMAGNGVCISSLDPSTLALRQSRVVGTSPRVSALVALGRELLAVYSGGSRIQIQRLRADGAPLAPPTEVVAAEAAIPSDVRAVAIDADSLMLLYLGADAQSAGHFDLYALRIDKSGKAVRPALRISRDPYLTYGSDFALTKLGPEVIVAWSHREPQHALYLARVRP